MTFPTPLPRILLTNDDGFDAPGLAVLAEVARLLSDEVWIVAPENDQSGKGQSLSLNNPLRAQPRGEKQWAVTGTPADCVILALSHLMLDNRPTLLLSGINNGANIGDDVNLSGTLGAAFTGLMLGTPSIGISMDAASRKHVRWQTARETLPRVLSHFLGEGWDHADTCLSINIPDRPVNEVTGFSWAQPAAKTVSHFHVEMREDLREKDYFWLYPGNEDKAHPHNTDFSVLARGEIAVTALTLDRSVAVENLRLFLMSDDRLPTDMMVAAQIRIAARDNVPITVVRRGDNSIGTIILKINRLDGTAHVLTQARYEGDLVLNPVSRQDPMPDAEAEKYLARQMDIDPDSWVVEIEDRQGRHWFPGRIVKT